MEKLEIIQRHLQEFSSQSHGVRTGRDIEYLHRMRVALRRLRNSFWIADDIPAKDVDKWRKSFREFSEISGQTRDLDVFIVSLQDLERRLRPTPNTKKAFQKLIAQLRQQRWDLQPQLISALDNLGKKSILEQIQIGLKNHSQGDSVSDIVKLKAMGAKKIFKRLRELLSYTPYVPHPHKHKELHQMRIAAKHLRYTLETFAPFYHKKISFHINSVLKIQQLLGKVHDADVRCEIIEKMKAVQRDEDLKKGLEFIRENIRKLREQAYQQFFRFWNLCEKQKRWKKLKEFIQGEVQ